jgi:hypothetical protein
MPRSRYQPLIDALITYRGDTRTLSFAQIERLIGGALPLTARSKLSYWHYPNQTVTRLLHRIGWYATLDPAAGTVTFVRGPPPPYQRPSFLNPLLAYLADQPGETLRLSLDAIAQILGKPLSSAARHDPAWWDGRERHAGKWEALGWRARLDIAGGAVTFMRSDTAESR